jgi:hypothetical protein
VTFVGSKFLKPYDKEPYKITVTPCKNPGGMGTYTVTLQQRNGNNISSAMDRTVSVDDDPYKIKTIEFDVNIILGWNYKFIYYV